MTFQRWGSACFQALPVEHLFFLLQTRCSCFVLCINWLSNRLFDYGCVYDFTWWKRIIGMSSFCWEEGSQPRFGEETTQNVSRTWKHEQYPLLLPRRHDSHYIHCAYFRICLYQATSRLFPTSPTTKCRARPVQHQKSNARCNSTQQPISKYISTCIFLRSTDWLPT